MSLNPYFYIRGVAEKFWTQLQRMYSTIRRMLTYTTRHQICYVNENGQNWLTRCHQVPPADHGVNVEEWTAAVTRWAAKFKRERGSHEYDPRPGRPTTATIKENDDKIHIIWLWIIDDSPHTTWPVSVWPVNWTRQRFQLAEFQCFGLRNVPDLRRCEADQTDLVYDL